MTWVVLFSGLRPRWWSGVGGSRGAGEVALLGPRRAVRLSVESASPAMGGRFMRRTMSPAIVS
eukprot:9252512-Pyramimonas_sp.AAC.1